MYRLLGKTVIRIMALDNFSQKIQSIKNMRPSPGFYIIMGPTDFIQDSYKLVLNFTVYNILYIIRTIDFIILRRLRMIFFDCLIVGFWP